MAKKTKIKSDPKIYLAGPDVFLPDAVEVGIMKGELCSQYGFHGLFPLDNTVEYASKPIFEANYALMEQADIGLFNLSPFRGPSADAGTVFELGAMYGMGKPVYGYTNTTFDYAKRTKARGFTMDANENFVDPEGMVIEDFGNMDNLMIEEALAATGGIIHSDNGGGLKSTYTFKLCLKRIQQDLSS